MPPHIKNKHVLTWITTQIVSHKWVNAYYRRMMTCLNVLQKSDGASSKDFKKTKTRENVKEALKSFVGSNDKILVCTTSCLGETSVENILIC